MKASRVMIATFTVVCFLVLGGSVQTEEKYDKCYKPFQMMFSYCMADITYFYYDIHKNICLPYMYGGCGEIPENSFPTRQACINACGAQH